MRLVRGWNQTGQKYAGEPDLVKVFLLPNPHILWLLVCLTYAWLAFRISAHLRPSTPSPLVSFAAGAVLAIAAFDFKVAFTVEDAPEIVVSWVAGLHGMFLGLSLVARARAVFAGSGAVAGWVVYQRFTSLGKTVMVSGEFLHALQGVSSNC